MNAAVSMICKYVLAVLMILYTAGSFSLLKEKGPKQEKMTFITQIILVVLFHTVGFAVILLKEQSFEILGMYFAEVIFMVVYAFVFRMLYPNSSRVILSHMLMFTAVSFIILMRLSFDKALRQLLFIVVACLISLIVPKMFSKIRSANIWTVVTGAGGLLLLITVLLLSSKTYGANLSLSIGPFIFQPSEFVKISFVLLTAYLFRMRRDLKMILLTGMIAAVHVLILVWSTDLGGALIYAFAYLFMLYAATEQAGWLIAGTAAFSGACVVAYKLFAHVRTRVAIWLDPWPLLTGKGSQVCNSLFGMATGGLLGTGLYEGSPKLIPVVEKDFIFSAIVEEMGGIIGICLILIAFCCMMKFILVAVNLKRYYYRVIAVGLASIYGIQVLLSVGGNIKFIPATGVTFPLLSYGGSSVFSTFILFSVMQLLFEKAQDRSERQERAV